MEILTTNCSARNHPEFCLKFDSTLLPVDVASLASFLEQSVLCGTRFEDGQTIDFGSMIIRLSLVDGVFNVDEPDMARIPIKWQGCVTESVRLLRLQKDIAESVGLGDQMDFPSIRHSLLLGADLVEGVGELVLERLQPNGSDSGWFLGRLDTDLDYGDAANLQRISVYQAMLSWRPIAGFLALPAGSRVETSHPLRMWFQGERLKVHVGSFLDAWRKLQVKTTEGSGPVLG